MYIMQWKHSIHKFHDEVVKDKSQCKVLKEAKPNI